MDTHLHNSLTVHGVTKIFGTGHTAVKALNQVHLHVPHGQIILIMGPSGSGKTTLLTVAGGLLKPTSGQVWVEKQEISKLSEARLPQIRRRDVGFIFQNFNLLENLSALDNVAVVLRLSGTSSKKAREEARSLLVELGLSERLNFRPNKLSGGEKQRVSVARALANSPHVILADEPTANLDSRNGLEVMRLLREVAKKQNRTVLIVSHDRRISEIADKIYWLEDGRLFEDQELKQPKHCQCEKGKNEKN